MPPAATGTCPELHAAGRCSPLPPFLVPPKAGLPKCHWFGRNLEPVRKTLLPVTQQAAGEGRLVPGFAAARRGTAQLGGAEWWSQQHPKALSFRAVATLKQNHAARGCLTHAEALSAAEAQLLIFSASPSSRSASPMPCSPWGWISHTQGSCAQWQLRNGNKTGLWHCWTSQPCPKAAHKDMVPSTKCHQDACSKEPARDGHKYSREQADQIHAHSAAWEDGRALGWRNAPWGLPSAQSSRRQGRQTAVMPGYFLQRTASGQGRDSLSEGTAAR